MNFDLINAYLQSKELAWEASSMKSERARLTANIIGLELGPDDFFKQLQGTKKPYTIKTIFIRLADFQQWLIDTNNTLNPKNDFKIFMKTNRKLFKNVYEKEVLSVDFQEAKRRVEAIKDEGFKAKVLQLLLSGSRWTESSTLDNNGIVQGKGRKRRKLFNVNRVEFKGSYRQFLRKLKRETGLKPHSLRKLFATHLVENGIKEADLMTIMGWSTIATASSYVQAKREEELGAKLKLLVGA